MPRSLIRRLRDDERGVSAVEFALVAPVMIIFYAGMVDLCQGYMALTRTSHVAATVADLASQSATLKKSDIKSIFEIGPAIMTPFNSTSLDQKITSITRQENKKYTTDWTCTYVASGPPTCSSGGTSAITIPADLLDVGESIIVGESAYTYKSIFQQFLPEVRYVKRSLIMPRGASTTCSDC